MSIPLCSTRDIDLPSSDGTVPEKWGRSPLSDGTVLEKPDPSPPSWFLYASIFELVTDSSPDLPLDW